MPPEEPESPEDPKAKTDYAAIVARAAQLKATTTLATIIERNMVDFRGFADAGGDLQTAIDFVADQENCNANSLRRTFLDRMGPWIAFCKAGVGAAPTAPTVPRGPLGNGQGSVPYNLVFGSDDNEQ